MALPLPLGMKEKGGWWAKPKPFITLPFVVGSVCGHTLSGATLPPKANSIPAAEITHCSECTAVEVTRPNESPIAGIPTVIGSICRHALGGINTPIGANTIPAAVTSLCSTCTLFSRSAQKTSVSYKQWQDSVKAYSCISGPEEEDPTDNPMFRDYLSGRKLLARHYERLRLTHELSTWRLLESVDPALPIVNLDGVALLPAHESEPSIPPQAKQATLRRVKFDEDQQHPSRETARRQLQYKRIQRGRRNEANAYRPGKYTDPTGRGWENTSSPELYESGDGFSVVDMPMKPFRFVGMGFGDSSAASMDSASSADDTPASGPDAVQEGALSSFSIPLRIYTPSSPLPQPQQAEEDLGEGSSVSER